MDNFQYSDIKGNALVWALTTGDVDLELVEWLIKRKANIYSLNSFVKIIRTLQYASIFPTWYLPDGRYLWLWASRWRCWRQGDRMRETVRRTFRHRRQGR